MSQSDTSVPEPANQQGSTNQDQDLTGHAQPASNCATVNGASRKTDAAGKAVEAALHNDIVTHARNNGCCNLTTSYIHVYHHATECCASPQAVPGMTAAKPEEVQAPTDNKADIAGGVGPIALVKQIFDNFKFDSPLKAASIHRPKQDPLEQQTSETSQGDTAPEANGKDPDHSSAGWDDEEDLVPPPPPVRRIWQGFEGIAVMTFAVATPMLLTVLSMASCPKRITLVMLNHPVETIVELLLLLSIPIANYRLWASLCKNDLRFTLRRGLLVGASIAMSLIVTGLSFAAIPAGYQELQNSIGTDFTTGFFFIGMQGLTCALIGAYLLNKTRLKREFASSRARVFAYTLAGFLIGLLAFTASEARSWYVRSAEQQAMSSSESERAKGLEILRSLDTERELRMETSDARAAGISGLFIPVKHSDMAKLYFTVYGKPLGDENSADFSSMSDDYLQRHVVGSAVKGLALARSAFNGMVSPNALTSTINWTFVFRNDTENPQEARAELALPPGAVINGLTVWKNGDALDASFAAAGKAEGDAEINWVDVGHDNPAIITDLGRGRYLFHCYPIPHDEQLKVNITVVTPLQLEGLDSGTLTFPRFISTNFDLGNEHALLLESPDKLSSRQENIKGTADLKSHFILSGNLQRSQLEHTPLVITAHRSPDLVAVASLDKIATDMELQRWKAEEEKRKQEEEAKKDDDHQVVLMIDGSRGVRQQIEDVKTVLNRDRRAKKAAKRVPPGPRYAVRTISEVITKAPKRLIVVLDGSESIKEHLPKVKEALSAVPDSVPVSLCVASKESRLLEMPTKLKEAMPKLDKVVFAGGQDNLKSVVTAAEMAGETEGGAVLWIHGPQPGLNKDIYIMSPFRAHPAFFELSLDTSCTDTLEYFKNHAEVGPFAPIPRTNKLAADLNDFFSKWQAGRREFVVKYSLQDKLAKGTTLLAGREKGELLILNARNQVDNFLHNKQPSKAARIAVSYQFVSPASCVAVIDNTGSQSAPVLQGATNGTIGPQGADATIIMGVNTAGTVRVNNLANLEALLNIICNMIEMAALVLGAVIISHGLFIRGTVTNFLGLRASFTPGMRLALGAIIVTTGFTVPGLVNWFVASARDANLFS